MALKYGGYSTLDKYRFNGEEKYCIQCRKYFMLIFFPIRKSRPDGLGQRCHKCQTKLNHKRYIKQRDK